MSRGRSAGIKNLRVQDLRQTFASRLVRRGADLKIGQELVGHASIVMFLRYLHVLGKEKLAAVERFRSPSSPVRRGKRASNPAMALRLHGL